MKHNWLFKNLSDIGKIQQTHVPGTSIIFFTITDSNNTNTHIKNSKQHIVNTQYNVYIMTWI